ncbi:hypothetical protein AVEN_253704-1 [Araneus ventricosus]|uniref:Uncharacterized protein n=1 Tax=Araneus ventricosus TaxID=182803 RepID=A0A4Y2DXU8_ARAVE|nr:hypothetical protein AVEN_253704-1 [Araneus ventricosus]
MTYVKGICSEESLTSASATKRLVVSIRSTASKASYVLINAPSSVEVRFIGDEPHNFEPRLDAEEIPIHGVNKKKVTELFWFLER